MVDRNDRETETRSEEERAKPWTPPQILPDPNPRAGWEHRYIRVSLLGEMDVTNVSQRIREGWEPCKADEYPEIMAKMGGLSLSKSGNIEIGGLMLCRMPTEMFQQRLAYYDKLAKQQIESVDNNLMRENDPRMPLFKQARTKVTFGRR